MSLFFALTHIHSQNFQITMAEPVIDTVPPHHDTSIKTATLSELWEEWLVGEVKRLSP